MDDELKEHLTAAETWTRGLFMLLIAFLMEVAKVVTGAVVVLQFLFAVFSGEVNANLRQFGASLAHYIFQCVRFLTYNSDEKPFPFQAWPTPEADAKMSTEKSAEGGRDTEVAESLPPADDKPDAKPS